MKKFKNILYIFFALTVLFACEEVEREPVVVPGDAPVLSAPSAGTTMVFEKLGAEENLVTFNWSEADFGFPSATSYTLQLDLAGNNFAAPLSLVTTSGTTASFTQALLNDKLLGFGLATNEATDMEARIAASVNPDVETLYSATVTLNITLYASVFPSIYMIGACTGGWDTAKAVEVVSTGEPYEYTTIALFDVTNGTNFRFFNAPDWGVSLGGYDVFTSYPTDLLEPASSDSDPNFNFIGANGWYELLVNSNAGTIEMTATAEPGMYLTGDATHGWDWDEPVTTLTWVGYKIWEGDVEFINGNAFRLFAQKDWSPTSYGWNYVVNYDTNYIDVMPGHADPNWQFVAPSGTYHVKVDLRKLSIEISEL